MPPAVKRVVKKCKREACRKAFEVRITEVGKPKERQFCSLECKYKWGSAARQEYERSPKKCLACGESLSYEKKKNKFCSRECFGANYSTGARGPYARNPKKCQLCGESILFERKHNKKYCSAACQYKGIYYERIALWLSGGKVMDKHMGIIKRWLMGQHDSKCEICGWGAVNVFSNTIPLEVHHIDGNAKNNESDNLQLLCPNCHSLTATNKGIKRNEGGDVACLSSISTM